MDFSTIPDNLGHPAVMFFFLGLLAVFVRSDLEIPPQIGKFLSIYLLFHIGIKGGWELVHGGLSGQVLVVLAVCILGSFLAPFPVFFILRRKLSVADAGATAATYGSISAVTFATASSFLDGQGVTSSGYMVAGMALMESPAIISGLILIRYYTPVGAKKKEVADDEAADEHGKLGRILHEAVFNGSVFLLVGSMVIGYVSGSNGQIALQSFVDDIFYGMLSFYMLDMGLLAGRRLGELRRIGGFVVAFALVFPLAMGAIGIAVCYVLGYSEGDALLQTVLLASASYIAVPAAMRIAVPEANMSVVLPMSLGITFTFNIVFGIPVYFFAILAIW